jgi:G3E family GTPase
MSKPVPAWVVTGPLGSGKTTLIAEWLAAKEPAEHWVVLLNEYSDAGIDALTVAAAARGAYDVRLVPGGCLCCVGEADFRRNLQELVDHVRPAGIIVEPSGIGHPGGIVEELLAHEAAGGIRLCGVVGLIDPARIDSDDDNVVAVREIADALVLSKSDLATVAQRERFHALAATLFPPKSWTGEITGGQLPPILRTAIETGVIPEPATPWLPGVARRPVPARPPGHGHRDVHEHAAHHHAARTVESSDGERLEFHHLGRHGARWLWPRSRGFSETRLLSLLSSDLSLVDPALRRPERFKAVLRVEEDQWLLVQMADGRVSMQPTAWRRDNRLELHLAPGEPWDAQAWDRLWSRCLRT